MLFVLWPSSRWWSRTAIALAMCSLARSPPPTSFFPTTTSYYRRCGHCKTLAPACESFFSPGRGRGRRGRKNCLAQLGRSAVSLLHHRRIAMCVKKLPRRRPPSPSSSFKLFFHTLAWNRRSAQHSSPQNTSKHLPHLLRLISLACLFLIPHIN